jgi:hypothetical protein
MTQGLMIASRTGSMSRYVTTDLPPQPAATLLSALPAWHRCQHLGGVVYEFDRGPYPQAHTHRHDRALYSMRLDTQSLKHGFSAAHPIRPWGLNMQVYDSESDHPVGDSCGVLLK